MCNRTWALFSSLTEEGEYWDKRRTPSCWEERQLKKEEKNAASGSAAGSAWQTMIPSLWARTATSRTIGAFPPIPADRSPRGEFTIGHKVMLHAARSCGERQPDRNRSGVGAQWRGVIVANA